jgi:hypothetical protein
MPRYSRWNLLFPPHDLVVMTTATSAWPQTCCAPCRHFERPAPRLATCPTAPSRAWRLVHARSHRLNTRFPGGGLSRRAPAGRNALRRRAHHRRPEGRAQLHRSPPRVKGLSRRDVNARNRSPKPLGRTCQATSLNNTHRGGAAGDVPPPPALGSQHPRSSPPVPRAGLRTRSARPHATRRAPHACPGLPRWQPGPPPDWPCPPRPARPLDRTTPLGSLNRDVVSFLFVAGRIFGSTIKRRGKTYCCTRRGGSSRASAD